MSPPSVHTAEFIHGPSLTSSNLLLLLFIISVYDYKLVCVCGCEREQEREREPSANPVTTIDFPKSIQTVCPPLRMQGCFISCTTILSIGRVHYS